MGGTLVLDPLATDPPASCLIVSLAALVENLFSSNTVNLALSMSYPWPAILGIDSVLDPCFDFRLPASCWS